jgi:3-hydroxyisobutyrate dehydrogenase-like beta-hydroxyacid dehydrogenase
MQRPVVGFVGVGLMGHGMAKNAVEKGFPLRVVAHRRREAVDDLVGRGAVECADLAAMAREIDVAVLCVTGSPEVEAALAAIVPAARPGLTVIDSSTSDPQVTARLAAELGEKGVTLIDAPLSRTPAHAWSGELTTYVGGPRATAERWRDLFESWASAVIFVDAAVGSAHALKLVNNLVSIGYAAIWAECYAMVERMGAEPAVFREIVSNSGMNCGNFQAFSKYAVEGDASAHRFTLANCFKDLAYYERMATSAGAATLMSDGALQTCKLGLAMGMGERYIPEMLDVVRRLNGEGAR